MKIRFSWYARCASMALFGVASAFVEAKELIQLQKILFNHVPESPLPNNDKRIELGSLTLYFSGRPDMHLLPQESKNANRVVFFIPQVELKDAGLKKTVASMRRAPTQGFHCILEEKKFPVNGVMLTLDIDDPQKIAYSYDSVETVGMNPGVVFTFFNRTLINELKAKTVGKGLLRMACSQKKNTVVLDCGHGGLDKGAAPYKGIEEKNITLAVGREVADLLKKKGVTVILTRANDATRSLDERAAIALKVMPTLFVSLHANASPRTSALGIETHVMNPLLFSRVRDTFTSEERSFSHTFFAERCSLSADCGREIQRDLVSAAVAKNPETIDRGVKQSVIYVLLGSRVPAVLVEMGFVSHEKEAQLLNSKPYQQQLAHGLCDGIMHALERLQTRIA